MIGFFNVFAASRSTIKGEALMATECSGSGRGESSGRCEGWYHISVRQSLPHPGHVKRKMRMERIFLFHIPNLLGTLCLQKFFHVFHFSMEGKNSNSISRKTNILRHF